MNVQPYFGLSILIKRDIDGFSPKSVFGAFFFLPEKEYLYKVDDQKSHAPKTALKKHIQTCLQELQKLFLRVFRAQFIALSEFGKLRKSST